MCLVQTQLEVLQHELVLSEETGRDLCTQLLCEKEALLQVLELVSFHCGHVPHTHCSLSTWIAVPHAEVAGLTAGKGL